MKQVDVLTHNIRLQASWAGVRPDSAITQFEGLLGEGAMLMEAYTTVMRGLGEIQEAGFTIVSHSRVGSN